MARRIDGPSLRQGIVSRLRCNGDGGIKERAVEVGAEVRLRSAGPPLIDEDEISAWGVGGPSLMVGVYGEGAAGAAADINDGLGERRLLCPPNNDDGQLEPACAGIRVIPRNADCAAAQARTDVGREAGQIASRLLEDGLRQLPLAAGRPIERKSAHKHQDTDRPGVSQCRPALKRRNWSSLAQ